MSSVLVNQTFPRLWPGGPESEQAIACQLTLALTSWGKGTDQRFIQIMSMVTHHGVNIENAAFIARGAMYSAIVRVRGSVQDVRSLARVADRHPLFPRTRPPFRPEESPADEPNDRTALTSLTRVFDHERDLIQGLCRLREAGSEVRYLRLSTVLLEDVRSYCIARVLVAS